MAQGRFGTFSGVFLPNVLTIFGVILFYREGWVVGNTGLLGTIIIISLANLITTATALSLSAIVTNIKVKGGGAYFLVSRSLGPEIGGAIGISLFFAQTFSISFYIIGFTRALSLLPPFQGISIPVLNLVTLALLTLLSIFSAGAAIKAQYIIFLMVMAAIFSFIAGNIGSGPFKTFFSGTAGPLGISTAPQLFGPYTHGTFWKSFAIFFPAVTGIFAGLSLSGDLRSPEKSLPRGTLLAIGFTYVFYMLIAVIFAYAFNGKNLLENETLMMESALVPVLVLIGIFAATISSAIGVLLGAPRTLQALARDDVVPAFLGKGSGPDDEPRVAMIFSVLLASTLLLAGSIDFVSQLLTMFFLASYGIVNFIAGMEVLIGNPAYRPRFRVHWTVSIIGAFGAFGIMFMIDKVATIVSLVIIIVLYSFYTRQNLRKNWGDIRKGFWASIIEIGLANYHKYEQHPRNFRPHIAILENRSEARGALVEFAALLSGRSGIISGYVFPQGRNGDIGRRKELLDELRSFFSEQGVPYVFPEVICSDRSEEARMIALQADGIGDFKANTILTDFSSTVKSLEPHFRMLRRYVGLNKNVVLIKERPDGQVFSDRIDIWLSGFKANISMMLLIPFLISRNPDWSETQLCLRMIVPDGSAREQAERNLTGILQNARINAEAVVVALHDTGEEKETAVSEGDSSPVPKEKGSVFTRLLRFFTSYEPGKYTAADQKAIRRVIQETSSDARLVVMGLHVPDPGKEKSYAESVSDLTSSLPMTILVKGNQEINLFK